MAAGEKSREPARNGSRELCSTRSSACERDQRSERAVRARGGNAARVSDLLPDRATARSTRAPTRVRSSPARPPQPGEWGCDQCAGRSPSLPAVPEGVIACPLGAFHVRKRFRPNARTAGGTPPPAGHRAHRSWLAVHAPGGRPARSDRGCKPRLRVQRQLPHPCSAARFGSRMLRESQLQPGC
jgi:hypothetical protein